MPFRELLSSCALTLSIETLGRHAHARLVAAAEHPAAVQRQTLGYILRRLAPTQRGRELDYARIQGPDAFRQRVPIVDYEALRPSVDRQIRSGEPALAPTRPLMYARTSGTTGLPKLIPVTRDVASALRRAQRAFAYVQHRDLDAFRGRLLAISGALREETLPDGTAAGSATGLIYATMPRLIRARYVVPTEVFALADYDLKYATIARLAVQHSDVSLIATANPATILRLLQQIEADGASLAADLTSGESRLAKHWPRPLADRLVPLLCRNPGQARLLEGAQHLGTLSLADLWPNLRGVMTWLGASCAAAASEVRALLPAGAGMIDAGYVASEVRGTIVVDAASNLAMPLLDAVFFEFAPVEEWDAGARETRLLHQIEHGASYYVIVTTLSGLVRYDMNDVVRVTGRIGATPTLEFVRKGRGVTNITGEKLTEDQVNTAMIEVSAQARIATSFYLVVADAQARAYRAYIEAETATSLELESLARSLDAKLRSLNIEYEAKRASQRLALLQVTALRRGAGRAYREHCVRQGQRESQLKLRTLQATEEVDFDFAAHGRDWASDAASSR